MYCRYGHCVLTVLIVYSKINKLRIINRYEGFKSTPRNVFEQLKSEGYVEGNIESRTDVNRVLPEKLLDVAPGRPTRAAASSTRRLISSGFGQRATLFPGYEDRPTRAFRANLTALDRFPIDLWTRLTERCLRQFSTRNLMGCGPLGYTPCDKRLPTT